MRLPKTRKELEEFLDSLDGWGPVITDWELLKTALDANTYDGKDGTS